MGLGGICGDGVVGTGETCEAGQTQQTDCTIGGVVGAGRRQQVCQSDCKAFVDVPGATCVPRIQCGNGRIETGESCDDGDLNGRYGHCNRSCNGFAAVCGDNQLSAGESCDLGSRNGLYCDTRTLPLLGTCNLSQSCSLDCRDVAPHCGDGIVQSELTGFGSLGGPVEQCDGDAPQTTTQALCTSGLTGKACTTNEDCRTTSLSPGVCGQGAASANSCASQKVGLCAGGLADRRDCACPPGQDSCYGTPGSAAAVCGTTYRCVMYPTQRTRTCTPPGAAPSLNQCSWSDWSACRPSNFCGDGILDTGEACDDGNRNDNDACTNRCLANVCGDGVMNVGAEECDYGGENGHGCTGAEYGSTCAACTNQCRMTASSGGFCGNAQVDGSEQCDGADFGRASGVQTSAGLTCTGLGFDYAERVRCTDATNPAATIEVASNDAETSCVAGTARDIIACSRTCGYGGCQTCASQTGTATIHAVVYDAVYSDRTVPGATVTLLQNGRRITTQTTNADGEFTFSNLNGNRSCGGYRVYVELTRDNPNTPDNEATNGGYWMYESNLFSAPTFERDGIQSSESPGKIFLLPKVGRDETLVVHTWYGNLTDNSNRYLLSHLILPQSRAYAFTPGAGRGSDWSQTSACTAATHPGFVPGGKLCYRDIREFVGGNEAQGNPDLNAVPNARLYCSSGAGGVCFQVAHSPQATRYRWTLGSASTGNFSYFLVDQRSALGVGMSPSYQYYRQTSSTVWIVTQARVYKVLPPTTTPAPSRCQGKYWLVFQQSAVDGSISVMTDAARALLCGGESIPGETVTPALPDSTWPASSEAQSWMAFGGWGTDYRTPPLNWDPLGSGPGAR